MKHFSRWIGPALIMALCVTSPLAAQGKGQEKGKDEHQKHGQQAPKAQKSENKARNAGQKADHKADHKNDRKQEAQAGKKSARGRAAGQHHSRVANVALARAHARGNGNDAFVLDGSGDRVRIKNRNGDVLIDLDEDRARTLGAWDVRPAIDRGDANAPSFCRSGAGHPNWGRQWCIDKGFGLGNSNNIRWGSATTVGDIIFGRQVTTGSLARDVLLGVIGDLAFNRLGLHAVTLGYSEPLTGVWVADQSGPRVLQISSGSYPVAEFVDANRDNRADLLVVALPTQ